MTDLTPFQITCERKLLNELASIGRELVGREVITGNETYITGKISKSEINIWIYEDEAQYASKDIDKRFEVPDYVSAEELGAAFVRSVGETLRRT